MDDFKEIAHSGGIIEFNREEKGLSISISNSNPGASSLYQVSVTPEGKITGSATLGSVAEINQYNLKSISAWIISDQNGLFGRTCPECKSYFRTDSPANPTYCPYCNFKESSIKFLTANQIKFIEIYRNTFIEAYYGSESIIIDLDKLADSLDNNKSAGFIKRNSNKHRIRAHNAKLSLIFWVSMGNALNVINIMQQKLLLINLIALKKILKEKNLP